ncbi:uncharacterized protein IWZ02DRAFT_494391 [Phyllosticta citriasiana]|uniref:uncharacterized protein n=1 Tax=Phyllosticta citriasiana TaxID=595635 RepID=UPI0030FD7B77
MSSDLLTSDITKANGVSAFINALKTTSFSKLEGEEMKQVMERVAKLAADTSEAKKALLQAPDGTKAKWSEMLGKVADKARADKEAQKKHQSKTSWLKLFSDIDEFQKKLRPSDPQIQKRIQDIEEHWGVATANRYMKLSPSTLGHLVTIAANADHAAAVSYLNAEAVARKERKANGGRGNIPTGLGITPSDAKNVKAKVQAETPIPTLSTDLLAKHKLRVSKTTGLLKPVEGDESDEEVDLSEDDEESGSGQEDEDKVEENDDQEQNDDASDEEEECEDSKAEAEPSTATSADSGEAKDQEGEGGGDESNSNKKEDEVADGKFDNEDAEQHIKTTEKVEGSEDDCNESNTGLSTCTGVKRQLGEQEDAQQSEKRVRLSVDGVEEPVKEDA